MEKLILFLLIFSCSLFSCGAQKPTSAQIQKNWLQTLNIGGDLNAFYGDKAGLFIKDQLFTEQEDIVDQLAKLKTEALGPLSYKIVDTYQLRDQQKFQLGYYQHGAKTYYSIIGWRLEDLWRKEIEVIYEADDNLNPGSTKADEARRHWEYYSNGHQSAILVDSIFAPNGYYFNRGKVFPGAAIKEAYSYMDQKSWQITLESLNSMQVNEDVLYDIGLFQSGGKGLYILIWGKVEDAWRVLLDFNF